MQCRWLVAPVAIVALSATPVPAHHSLVASYDVDNPITLTGTLKKVEWVNPHSFIWLDVKNERGEIETWGFELAGQGAFRRAGLSRIDRGGFKVGETYTAYAFAARNGKPMAFLKEMKMPDGRVVLFWFGDPNAR